MRDILALLSGAGLAAAWTELLHDAFMTKNIDAIVSPGAYSSHMHTFFGSDSITNVMPTTEELQQGCYSGENPNDLSVYWVPTLYHVDGDKFTEVPFFSFGTYYTAAYAEIPIPPNFSMISGNASAQPGTEPDQPENGLEWYCEESDEREPEFGKMPTKSCEQHLRFSLLFPNCVDPDDITNYAFSDSATNSCPEGMRRMPQLRISSRYDTRAVAPDGWEGGAPFQLSCSDTPGEGACFHGDFINGWFEDAAEDMLVGGGSGRDDGRFISGSHGSSAVKDDCTPADRDPDHGTSDYWVSLEMMENGGGTVADGAAATTPEAELTPVSDAASSSSSGSPSSGRRRGRKSRNGSK